jgi:arsenate reductase-like glutaredoxin family protein
MGEEEALAMASEVDEIWSMKGKKVVHLHLKRDKPDRETLLAALLGPSGNLRAPTVRQGRRLLVGFSPELFNEQVR